MLEILDLTIKYSNNEILSNVNLSIKSNQIVSIIGENGSGKTSLIRCISTLLLPSSGMIYLENVPYNSKENNLIRKKISVLIDGSHSLYGMLTVQQNINYYSRLYNINFEKIQSLMNVFEMNKYKHELFSQLSTGNKQKIALIIALAKESSLLILDEPDIGLDKTSIDHFIKILLDEKRNRAILLTSHNSNLISQISDEVYSIEQYKLLPTTL